MTKEQREKQARETVYTGFVPENLHTVGGDKPPLSATWITEELLDETRRVWSEVLGRGVSADEATEMLMNVKRFAAVLLKAHAGGEQI